MIINGKKTHSTIRSSATTQILSVFVICKLMTHMISGNHFIIAKYISWMGLKNNLKIPKRVIINRIL